ncbi:MAG: acetyltransferase [Rhodocyclales bacterium]|nr:acetyltransferase [Rhodocyclales bacterium]
MRTADDPLELAGRVRNACVLAALDGYERAQVAGLCQEGAWEAAVDAMRMIDLRSLLQERAADPAPPGPASA